MARTTVVNNASVPVSLPSGRHLAPGEVATTEAGAALDVLLASHVLAVVERPDPKVSVAPKSRVREETEVA